MEGKQKDRGEDMNMDKYKGMTRSEKDYLISILESNVDRLEGRIREKKEIIEYLKED